MNFTRKRFLIFIFIFLIFLGGAPDVFADEPIIYSPSAILIDAKSGQILYDKNSEALMYPASTTKILTAIIAIESCPLDTQITASHNAITSVKKGYTNANIQVGETLSMQDLLYALMLNSANEAANVIAEHLGGTTENFANIMNAKAIELGCRNTHFVNANGIHSDEHYTTASDLATIMKYCMQNEIFRTIIASQTYILPATEKYPVEDRILSNTNSLMLEDHKFYYPYAIGGKTGFTTQAKNCLIAASKKDNLELISVVLHAETTDDGRSARYLDTINLLEYGNNNYKACCVQKKGEILDTLELSSSDGDTKAVNLVTQNDIFVTLKNTEELCIASSEILINPEISAPIAKGDVLGSVTFTINDAIYSTNLVADTDVVFPSNASAEALKLNLGIILSVAIIVVLGAVIFIRTRIISAKSRNLRKRTKRYLNP